MFSPKVLDRANVIEFKISEDEMTSFLSKIQIIDRNAANSKAANMGEDFVKIAKVKDFVLDNENIKVKVEGTEVTLERTSDEFKNFHGTANANISNMIEAVADYFAACFPRKRG